MAQPGECSVTPATLRELAADYLRVRRSLGYKLDYTERLLFGYIDYLEIRGAHGACQVFCVNSVVDLGGDWGLVGLLSVE